MGTIQADRTQPAVPLSLHVDRDGGITGLTIEAKIFDGGDVSQWLDFDDGNFKSVGHVDDVLALPEVDAAEAPGMYAVDGGFDLSAITVPAASLSLLVHYAITAGGESGNAVDVIQFQDRVVDLVWDELNRGADHNVKDSTGKQQRQASGGVDSQDVVSAGASTLELAATESAIDDYLIRRHIAITDGLGSGQVRVITAYDGTTKIATVSRPWDTIPDATSDYLILLSSEQDLTSDERTRLDAVLVAAHGAGNWTTGAGASPAVVAAAVWDALQAAHVLPGSFGLASAGWTGAGGGLTAAEAIQLQEAWTSLGNNPAAPITFDFPALLVQALGNVTPIDIVISVVGSAVTLTRQP